MTEPERGHRPRRALTWKDLTKRERAGLTAMVVGVVCALLGGGAYLAGGSVMTSAVLGVAGVALFFVGERFLLRRRDRVGPDHRP